MVCGVNPSKRSCGSSKMQRIKIMSLHDAKCTLSNTVPQEFDLNLRPGALQASEGTGIVDDEGTLIGTERAFETMQNIQTLVTFYSKHDSSKATLDYAEKLLNKFSIQALKTAQEEKYGEIASLVTEVAADTAENAESLVLMPTPCGSYQLRLRADTKAEAEQWMQEINQAIRDVSETSIEHGNAIEAIEEGLSESIHFKHPLVVADSPEPQLSVLELYGALKEGTAAPVASPSVVATPSQKVLPESELEQEDFTASSSSVYSGKQKVNPTEAHDSAGTIEWAVEPTVESAVESAVEPTVNEHSVRDASSNSHHSSAVETSPPSPSSPVEQHHDVSSNFDSSEDEQEDGKEDEDEDEDEDGKEDEDRKEDKAQERKQEGPHVLQSAILAGTNEWAVESIANEASVTSGTTSGIP
jgi:hypothetical protein